MENFDLVRFAELTRFSYIRRNFFTQFDIIDISHCTRERIIVIYELCDDTMLDVMRNVTRVKDCRVFTIRLGLHTRILCDPNHLSSTGDVNKSVFALTF